MAEFNRICKTCGKEYFFCAHCEKSLNSPQWMLLWHDDNCKRVFEIVSDYAQGRLPKMVAKAELNKCNLRVLYTFKENIRNIIEDIMEDEKVLEPQETEQFTVKKNRSSRKRK